MHAVFWDLDEHLLKESGVRLLPWFFMVPK